MQENTARNIEPEETTADALVTKSEAKVAQFREQIRGMITVREDKTFLVTITTDEQLTLADSVKIMVDQERKSVYEDVDVLCKKANDLHKSLVAKRNAAVAPYDALKDAIVSGANTYIREEKRKADEEAARLREIARKEEEERRLREAEELEKEGRQEEAEEILAEPIIPIAPVPEPIIPKVDARSYSAARAVPIYKAKVKNRLLFLQNVKPEVLIDCLNEAAWVAIESGLSRKAKALGKAYNIQGTELYEA